MVFFLFFLRFTSPPFLDGKTNRYPFSWVHPSQGSHATYAFCITLVIHENHATRAAHVNQTNMPRTRSPCVTLFVRLLCHLVTSFMIIAPRFQRVWLHNGWRWVGPFPPINHFVAGLGGLTSHLKDIKEYPMPTKGYSTWSSIFSLFWFEVQSLFWLLSPF